MIEVKNIWKHFNHHEVLRGLNITILKGETVVILGRSGAGKSVLLRVMMGLEVPEAGEVIINGTSLFKLKEGQRYAKMRDIGMLFQAAALFDSLTIGENTAFYLKQHGNPATKKPYSETEILEKVRAALAMVGLEGTQELMPSELSGGMRKRAALARLIVYRPKILLYDEPTTGLDPITAMQINELILQIQKELNATSVVVTHDICSAFHVADRIALNHEGKIAYITTKEKFTKIDDPIVQQFLKNSVPENGVHRDKERGPS